MINLKFKIKNLKLSGGFTFIEALVLLFIFSLITITFYSVLSAGTRFILMSKNRLGAVALANEKMEIIRNLKYEDVGITGGVVGGNIPQEEDMTQNGKNYKVRTLVWYEDDPFDGTLGGFPNDVAYKDYKTVKVKVSWNNGGADQGEVEVISRFVPRGLETVSTGDGVLVINVFSSQDGGAPVPQASVRLVNPDVGVDETIETDNAGSVKLTGAKESIQRYRLSISKPGYETVQTLPPYPDTQYNPVDVHASVIGGTLNMANIDMNKTSSIRLKIVDYLGNPAEGVGYEVLGGRKIGTEAVEPYGDVFNTTISESTDADGEKLYEDMSPGEYKFKISDSEGTYRIIASDPISPFDLAPDTDLILNVRVANKNMTSLAAHIITADTNEPISGAEVRLINAGLGYDVTMTTEEDGTAFFPIAETPPFEPGTYDMSVSADGFQNSDGQIEVVSGSVTETNIIMMAN